MHVFNQFQLHLHLHRDLNQLRAVTIMNYPEATLKKESFDLSESNSNFTIPVLALRLANIFLE